ncbi:MAG: ribosome-associated heat shock protein Hsp15 [Pseudohongiellaceae bacterium]|jgi:ribosome-associated heat shock protein Hsp15
MTAQSKPDKSTNEFSRLRIDKWLWAARFYKTRALAKQAIEGGKVHCDGQKVKASKEIEVGTKIQLRQGVDEKTVVVASLTDKRRGAPQAQTLYEETPESLKARVEMAQQRKSEATSWTSDGKPNKKQRRDIQRFKYSD